VSFACQRLGLLLPTFIFSSRLRFNHFVCEPDFLRGNRWKELRTSGASQAISKQRRPACVRSKDRIVAVLPAKANSGIAIDEHGPPTSGGVDSAEGYVERRNHGLDCPGAGGFCHCRRTGKKPANESGLFRDVRSKNERSWRARKRERDQDSERVVRSRPSPGAMQGTHPNRFLSCHFLFWQSRDRCRVCGQIHDSSRPARTHRPGRRSSSGYQVFWLTKVDCRRTASAREIPGTMSLRNQGPNTSVLVLKQVRSYHCAVTLCRSVGPLALVNAEKPWRTPKPAKLHRKTISRLLKKPSRFQAW